MGLIALVPILMLMDFFGVNITDGYVEGNMEYAEEYRKVLNKNIPTNRGYVSLERILYFYTVDDSLSFEEIYTDNLDSDLKAMKPVSEVCELQKYKYLAVCNTESLSETNQIDDYQIKSFVPPVEFNKIRVTSYFMEERTVRGVYGIHNAWDLAGNNQTPVYAVCDGKIKNVSFTYTQNTSNADDRSGGNTITIECDIEGIIYNILYAHLYPSSTTYKNGDSVFMGSKIAGIGRTGNSTGDHLHIEVNTEGNVIDIMSLIDFNYQFTYSGIHNERPNSFENGYNNGLPIR
jgi:Membrane proteins related to metalloendopeptidases